MFDVVSYFGMSEVGFKSGRWGFGREGYDETEYARPARVNQGLPKRWCPLGDASYPCPFCHQRIGLEKFEEHYAACRKDIRQKQEKAPLPALSPLPALPEKEFIPWEEEYELVPSKSVRKVESPGAVWGRMMKNHIEEKRLKKICQIMSRW